MARPPSTGSDSDAFASRLGAAAAGLLGGLAVGVLLGMALYLSGAETAAGWIFFICIAGGAVAGYLSASTGFALVEGVSHFLIGTASGIAQHLPAPSGLAPRWLRWVLLAGAIFGVLIYILRRW